ncbi:MAG: Crp/Fnr family transcriptional regulator [Alphaproteobacteria bacterium]|jgi:CRP/FNR family transcriptional regulator, anaerobic regulatory protein|nr:Crp/Fnr family transcriptional regulator [Alphaproteobacteria bacterium]MBU1550406.1 Crp/Fnr family transcriptional regulator [Alphaproteobacteria bacterium]MBU2338542.1 Crp/Fnr family transcriptional regulator [Alphaproteobacteria bacterium]MBU2389182.1 Crp/Fnr family transcriptional regulator [Alphaproteobacteria bacterium]
MIRWLDRAVFPASLEPDVSALLEGLRPVHPRSGTILFRPGDQAQAFLVLLSGRVGVYLTGRNGREILLYAVQGGETCVQTTLGMLGSAAYRCEALAETDLVAVMIPRSLFDTLMAESACFRAFVFKDFAARLADMMGLLEQVAFTSIRERLARVLVERAGEGDLVQATHQELAVAIGSAREVVSRRLEALASTGVVENERGRVRIRDRRALLRMAQGDGPERLVT